MFRLRQMFPLSFQSQVTSTRAFWRTTIPVRDMSENLLAEAESRSTPVYPLGSEESRLLDMFNEIRSEVRSDSTSPSAYR